MARRAALPSLKHWQHTQDTADYEDYTINLSPDGRLVQSRKWGDVRYTLFRSRGVWYVEFGTDRESVYLDANGHEPDEAGRLYKLAQAVATRFSSAAKARAAANKHWQRGA